MKEGWGWPGQGTFAGHAYFFSNVAIEKMNSEETQKKSLHSNILKKSGKLQRKAVQGAYDCEISFL
jgi:hypothetical protein